jgi:Tol biopolymer transport system component
MQTTRRRALTRAAGLTIGTLSIIGVVVAGTAGAATGSATTTLISKSPSGAASNAHSMFPGVSGNGRYVTFRSNATNLYPRKPNEPPARDVFLMDLSTGQLDVVSVDSPGHRLPGHSGGTASPVTSSGRYVAFDTLVKRPTPADPNRQVFDVVMRTRIKPVLVGHTDTISVGLGGAPANGSSTAQGLSEDGRFVVFTSEATNLVKGDTNGKADVFLRDNAYKMTTRVNVSNTGKQATEYSADAKISRDGRYVVYRTSSPDLVPGDTNAADDVFLFDRFTRKTELISVDSAGKPLVGASNSPSISGDGRYVVFTHGTSDFGLEVLLRDRVAKTTTLVSVGAGSRGFSLRPSISDNGGYVAFESSSALVPGLTGQHVYVRNLTTRKTVLVDVSNTGSPANGPTFFPAASNTGVAFMSLATNLGAKFNGNYQVYYRTYGGF